MLGQKEVRKFMETDKESEEKEKTQQQGEEKEMHDLIAPMIFTVGLNAEGFEGW